MSQPAIEQAYRECARITRAHYENFPVASVLLPRRLRKPISAVYAFARTADDFADEGELPPASRLELLDQYRLQLDRIQRGETAEDQVFIALADVHRRCDVPLQLFYDLLTAFRQDVTKKRYADFSEVLEYCRHSANPVGRLVLHLAGLATPENLRDSDAICSALQLINFYQDLRQAVLENDRIYLPQDEMAQWGVTDEDIRAGRNHASLRKLMDAQIARTRELMLSGAPLALRLRGRLGFEIRLTVQGGLRILDALAAQREDVFTRPRLRRADWIRMCWRALYMKKF